MRQVSRRIKRHFGVSAKRVTVRSQQPWYWQWLLGAGLVLLGYLLAYWQLAGGDFGSLHATVQQTQEENRAMQAKLVLGERQLQVERAAQSNLAKELARLQDEDMRLKEDVAFYKNILKETPGLAEVKLDSFRLNKGRQPNQYDFHILMIQSGRHDKSIQGIIKLVLNGTQAGKTVSQPLIVDQGSEQALKINFKYYQRVDGSFTLPADLSAETIEASFIETGSNAPKYTQKADLPN